MIPSKCNVPDLRELSSGASAGGASNSLGSSYDASSESESLWTEEKADVSSPLVKHQAKSETASPLFKNHTLRPTTKTSSPSLSEKTFSPPAVAAAAAPAAAPAPAVVAAAASVAAAPQKTSPPPAKVKDDTEVIAESNAGKNRFATVRARPMSVMMKAPISSDESGDDKSSSFSAPAKAVTAAEGERGQNNQFLLFFLLFL